MKIIKTFCMVLVLFAINVLPARAGWVETNQQREVTYYGNGVMKQVPSPEEGGPNQIMDFTKGTVTMVDNGSGTYTTFRFENFCDYLKGIFSAYPPNVLDMMKQQNQAQPKPHVSTGRIGKGETIAGFATTKYKVINNGELDRTVWIAENARLKKYNSSHGDRIMDSIKKMSRCDYIGMSGETVDTSPAYFNLMKKGWLMREELTNDDGMSGSSAPVVKLVEKNLPASTFSIPKGYRKVPLAQFRVSN